LLQFEPLIPEYPLHDFVITTATTITAKMTPKPYFLDEQVLTQSFLRKIMYAFIL
jgi:hypothetical protein